jgi:hypothetical protein
MTEDEIIDMANKAGLEVHKWKKTKEYQIRCWYEEFYDFAQLVAQHERDACVKVVDSWSDWHGNTKIISKAIQARGRYD